MTLRLLLTLFLTWTLVGLAGAQDPVLTFHAAPKPLPKGAITECHTLDLAVIGYAEGIDDRVGLLHDLLLAVVRGDTCVSGTWRQVAC